MTDSGPFDETGASTGSRTAADAASERKPRRGADAPTSTESRAAESHPPVTAAPGEPGPRAADGLSLQERYARHSICFGCGPANARGLKVRSFPRGDEVVAEWTPSGGYEAFPGVLNGGIIGSLFDCHSNWTAAYHLMAQAGAESPPSTVTAEYSVKLTRPTPSDGTLTLRARVVESSEDRAVVEATLEADGKTCATCRGTFVAVKPGHPAYHRW